MILEKITKEPYQAIICYNAKTSQNPEETVFTYNAKLKVPKFTIGKSKKIIKHKGFQSLKGLQGNVSFVPRVRDEEKYIYSS